MTKQTPCQHIQQLLWHRVSIVNEYTSQHSQWIHNTHTVQCTLCWCSQWLIIKEGLNICIITWSLWAFLSQQRELAPLRQKLLFFYLTPLCFTAASSYCHCVKKKTKINKTKTISYFNQKQKYFNPLVPNRTLL